MKNMETTLAKAEMKGLSNCRTGQFYDDVICGLNSTPKFLSSMYFYDAVGDKLFQDLMNCPEYYPTNCELEIFSEKTAEICDALIADGDAFDLIELGAGDAMKSTYLLKKAAALSPRRNVVLFLGSNIGNMPVDEAIEFCRELRNNLSERDMVLI